MALPGPVLLNEFTKGRLGNCGGWTRDGAIQNQIDDMMKDAIDLARSLMPSGQGETHSYAERKFPEEMRILSRAMHARW